jgi:hypothetical protein
MILIVSGKCVAQRENVHHSKVSYIQLLNERYSIREFYSRQLIFMSDLPWQVLKKVKFYH